LGYPELSKSVVVRTDGTIDYPLLAGIPIDGLRISELQDLLFPILTRYVERPRLFINIYEYYMLQVRVQGEVRNPGPFQVQGPIDLQGVLSIAGGALNTADLRNISIIRRENETTQTITIDLYEHLKDTSAAKLPDITNGDIIVVPLLTSGSYVRVVGAVYNPGNFIPTDRTANIVDMINLAGGVSVNGNLNNVYYISSSNTHALPQKIKIKKLLQEGNFTEIPLIKPGDIIIVNEYDQWQTFSWWAGMFRDFAYIASAALVISRI